ncbi:MAG: hypothetical protein MHPSP_004329 [Paramarteilia canceri]
MEGQDLCMEQSMQQDIPSQQQLSVNPSAFNAQIGSDNKLSSYTYSNYNRRKKPKYKKNRDYIKEELSNDLSEESYKTDSLTPEEEYRSRRSTKSSRKYQESLQTRPSFSNIDSETRGLLREFSELSNQLKDLYR